jgi:uncharacterized protein
VILKAILFIATSAGLLAATGPLLGILAALSGASSLPVWIYAAAFSALMLAASTVALKCDGKGLRNIGLVPTSSRVREFVLGFSLGVGLFVALALVRAAMVGATWSLNGPDAVVRLCAGLGISLVLLLPEELIFRGYAFQQLIAAAGARWAIVISAILFGMYHLVGSGMWGIGAFFQAAMPALGGVVFGWAAVRTRGLALPIGLHLGGNWVQSSVFSFQLQTDAAPTAVWTAHVGDLQQRMLFSPDLLPHLPFIVTMLIAMAVMRVVLSGELLQQPGSHN